MQFGEKGLKINEYLFHLHDDDLTHMVVAYGDMVTKIKEAE